MSTITQARKDIKLIASTMRGLVALDDMLGEGGSLEKIIADKKTEAATLDDALAQARANVADAAAEAEGRLTEANSQAMEILKDAEEIRAAAKRAESEAAAALDKARAEAGNILAQGRADGAKAAADADGRLGTLSAAITAAKEDLAVVEANRAKVAGEVEALKAEKAKLLKQFGG